MTEQTNTPDTELAALNHDLASLLVEQEALRKLMSEATAEADVDQLATLLPALSTLRWAIQDAKSAVAIHERRKEAERKEAERLAALANLPRPGKFGPVSNHYGQPFVFEADGRKYFAIDCEMLGECVEVSQAFYDAFMEEFAGKYYETDTGITLLMSSGDDRGTYLVQRVAQ